MEALCYAHDEDNKADGPRRKAGCIRAKSALLTLQTDRQRTRDGRAGHRKHESHHTRDSRVVGSSLEVPASKHDGSRRVCTPRSLSGAGVHGESSTWNRGSEHDERASMTNARGLSSAGVRLSSRCRRVEALPSFKPIGDDVGRLGGSLPQHLGVRPQRDKLRRETAPPAARVADRERSAR